MKPVFLISSGISPSSTFFVPKPYVLTFIAFSNRHYSGFQLWTVIKCTKYAGGGFHDTPSRRKNKKKGAEFNLCQFCFRVLGKVITISPILLTPLCFLCFQVLCFSLVKVFPSNTEILVFVISSILC